MNKFYQILGVDKTASNSDIKAAYKKLAKENHPDREGGNAELMKKINEAWDTLKDTTKRQQYDMQQASGGYHPFSRRGGSSENIDINSMFEDIMRARQNAHPFGGAHFGQGFRQVRRNPNTDIRFAIDLKKAYEGYNVTSKVRLQDGREAEFIIELPPGVENGTQIRFEQQGTRPNPNVPAGDVIFHLTVTNNQPSGFHRQGADLFGKVTISALDAITGCSANFENINGSIIRVAVPSGSQPGSLLRCPGYGFAQVNGGSNGHLFITLEVEIPKNLTNDQLILIENIKNQINGGDSSIDIKV